LDAAMIRQRGNRSILLDDLGDLSDLSSALANRVSMERGDPMLKVTSLRKMPGPRRIATLRMDDLALSDRCELRHKRWPSPIVCKVFFFFFLLTAVLRCCGLGLIVTVRTGPCHGLEKSARGRSDLAHLEQTRYNPRRHEPGVSASPRVAD